MANRIMAARYAGKCGGPTPDSACDGTITAGQSINYGGKGRVSHESCGEVSAENAAPAKGRTSYRRRSSYRSYNSYRPSYPRGRCEDAPCCGCCGPYGDGGY